MAIRYVLALTALATTAAAAEEQVPTLFLS